MQELQAGTLHVALRWTSIVLAVASLIRNLIKMYRESVIQYVRSLYKLVACRVITVDYVRKWWACSLLLWLKQTCWDSKKKREKKLEMSHAWQLIAWSAGIAGITAMRLLLLLSVYSSDVFAHISFPSCKSCAACRLSMDSRDLSRHVRCIAHMSQASADQAQSTVRRRSIPMASSSSL